MPRIDNPHAPEKPAAPPKEPHLALVTKGVANELVLSGLPTGGMMAIVMDPKDMQRGIFMMAIEKIAFKRMEFSCACGNPSCTRKVVFNGTYSGFHPQSGGGLSKPK